MLIERAQTLFVGIEERLVDQVRVRIFVQNAEERVVIFERFLFFLFLCVFSNLFQSSLINETGLELLAHKRLLRLSFANKAPLAHS